MKQVVELRKRNLGNPEKEKAWDGKVRPPNPQKWIPAFCLVPRRKGHSVAIHVIQNACDPSVLATPTNSGFGGPVFRSQILIGKRRLMISLMCVKTHCW